MKSAQVEPAEDAVRKYLMFLDDPSLLVDAGRVAALQEELAAASDPLGRLKIISALERASTPDGDVLRAEFVAQAGRFARDENIPVAAFLQMGVPRQVLVDAGLLPGGRTTGRTPVPGRRQRVGREKIASVAHSLPEGFTVRDLVESSGANRITVTKTLDDLLAAGSLVEVPADEQHQGPGRAPHRYRFI